MKLVVKDVLVEEDVVVDIVAVVVVDRVNTESGGCSKYLSVMLLPVGDKNKLLSLLHRN